MVTFVLLKGNTKWRGDLSMSDELFNKNNKEENHNSFTSNQPINYTNQNSNIEQENIREQGNIKEQGSEREQDNTLHHGNTMKQGNTNNQGNTNEQSVTREQYNNSTYSFWAEQIASSNKQYDDKTVWTNDTIVNHNIQSNYDNARHSFDLSDGNKSKAKKKTKFIGRAAKFIITAATFGLIAGGTFLGVNAIYYEMNPEATPFILNFSNDGNSLGGYQLNLSSPEGNQKIPATTVSKDKIVQATDITEMVKNTMPSIVTITSTYTQSYNWFGQQYDQENEGGGSGFIVGKNETELLIATNNHVVEGADPITVTFIDDTQAEAIIKGTDAIADLAVISIDLSSISKETLAAIDIAKLGDSESVKVGQMAIAIGNALGYGQSTTVGYISAKDREVAVSDKTMVLLQTDAAINPGNSGGALLNIKGEVIGINTVKYASSEVEGMGFAIPISRALPIINELMSREILKEEEKGYLGVVPNDVTEDISSMYNWPIGVYVTEMIEDGAAAKAGVLVGDIITKVNDTEITASTQLRDKVTSYRAGTEITITIMRNNNGKFEEKQIVVTLEKNPQLISN
jgi:serine protease Do